MMNPIIKRDFDLLKRFFQYLKPHKKWLVLGTLTVPFSVIISILNPWLLVVIVDDYIIPQNVSGLSTMIIIFTGCIILGYLADAFYSYSFQRAGNFTLYQMRQDLFVHALKLPRKYFDQNPAGVTLSRLTSDFEAIGESLAGGVLSIITDTIKTVGLFSFMFYLSWELALIVLFLLPIIIWTTSFVKKKLRENYNLARKMLAMSIAYLQECLQGVKTVQLYVAEKKTLEEYKKRNLDFLKVQSSSNIYDSFLSSFIEGITWVCVSLIIWYGSGATLREELTVGVIIGFISVLQKLFVPIREFAQQITVIQRSLAAIEHVEMLFNQKIEDGDNQGVTHIKQQALEGFQELVFENVSFRYAKNSPNVLENISFRLERGQRVALVGETGSGKTTIINLITKQYTGYTGSIRVNGMELSSISSASMKSLLTFMQQDSFLFNESVAFNIGLGRAGITRKDIQKAIRYVRADIFVNHLPEQEEHQIKDNGKNFSAGQAQLIALARSIVVDRDLFVLDEATGLIDSVTESLIQEAIDRIFSKKTVIVIAHRLSTIEHSDKIIALKNGKIMEKGSHAELLKLDGYYTQLRRNVDEPSIQKDPKPVSA